MTMASRRWRVLAGVRHHVIGVALCALCAGPILLMIYRSLQAGGALKGLTLANYRNLISNPDFNRWLINSLIVAVVTTALTLLIDVPAAYAFARLRFFGRRILFGLMMSTIMLPSAITLVPTYLLAVHYHLINTYAGIILPALAYPIGIYLLRQYILNLPKELIEAARMDGASQFRVLVSIIVPLVRQPMVVLGVLTFVNSWNAFIWPLLIGQAESMRTLPVGIATQNLQFVNNTGATMAQTVLSVIPIALLFAFLQRAFTTGLTAGAIKS